MLWWACEFPCTAAAARRYHGRWLSGKYQQRLIIVVLQSTYMRDSLNVQCSRLYVQSTLSDTPQQPWPSWLGGARAQAPRALHLPRPCRMQLQAFNSAMAALGHHSDNLKPYRTMSSDSCQGAAHRLLRLPCIQLCSNSIVLHKPCIRAAQTLTTACGILPDVCTLSHWNLPDGTADATTSCALAAAARTSTCCTAHRQANLRQHKRHTCVSL
jgi:hypothetical protein